MWFGSEQELAANGYQEVVLTGIHLSSYGVDLENENLLSLILAVNEIEGIKRIRLGSLEPRIITEDFVKRFRVLKRCVRIFIFRCKADAMRPFAE